MQPTLRARVGDALDLLFQVLRPYVEERMREEYGDGWVREARRALHNKPPARWDTSDLLTLVYFKFGTLFRELGHEARSCVSLLKETRKRWAHQVDLSVEETRRALDHAIVLLRALGADEAAARLEPQVLELMQEELDARLVGEDDADDAEAPLLARGLERVKSLIHRPPEEPLELRRAVLDAVEAAAAPHRRAFRFNALTVHVLAEERPRQQLFETALDGQREPFAAAVLRRLHDARVPVPKGLRVTWKVHRQPPRRLASCFGEQPWCVELQQRKSTKTATLTVVRGIAEQDRYVVRSGASTTVGRMPEVLDAAGRLVRRNTVAFDDACDVMDERAARIQRTVSRVHARIVFEPSEGHFCLYDDRSTCGTSVVRDGYPVPVQVGRKGVPLQDGDLLYFGEACVRFETGTKR